jgi:hypothetical protein
MRLNAVICGKSFTISMEIRKPCGTMRHYRGHTLVFLNLGSEVQVLSGTPFYRQFPIAEAHGHEFSPNWETSRRGWREARRELTQPRLPAGSRSQIHSELTSD